MVMTWIIVLFFLAPASDSRFYNFNPCSDTGNRVISFLDSKNFTVFFRYLLHLPAGQKRCLSSKYLSILTGVTLPDYSAIIVLKLQEYSILNDKNKAHLAYEYASKKLLQTAFVYKTICQLPSISAERQYALTLYNSRLRADFFKKIVDIVKVREVTNSDFDGFISEWKNKTKITVSWNNYQSNYRQNLLPVLLFYLVLMFLILILISQGEENVIDLF